MMVGRIGQALNPSRIARILSQCDAGYPAAWHDLLNELRQKDPPLHSLLQTRELALLSRGWSVSPRLEHGAEEPTSQDKEIADFCREICTGLVDFNRSLSHLLDGTYKAYSVCESEWAKVPGLGVVPVALHPIHGRRWRVTERQELVLYDDGLVSPPRDVIAEAPDRFVVHAPRVNGDALSREGLGRTVVWFSAFENWAWRDLLLFAEQYGQPSRHAEYDPAQYTSDTDDDIKAALDEILARGYTVFPKGVRYIINWPGGNGQVTSPSPGIIDKCLAWKALAILGQQGTTADVQAGLGGKGDVRDLVRKDIVKADDLALSQTIRWQVLAPPVRMRFGATAQPALFGFDVEDTVDVKALAEGLDKLADRLPIPQRYVYGATGIPKPTEGEPVLEKKAPAPVPGAAQPDDDKADQAPAKSDD